MSDQSQEPDYPKYAGVVDAGGSALQPPSPSEPPAPAVTRPPSIAIAVRLMWAGAALEVVARGLGLATGAYIGDAAPAQAPGGLAGVVVSGVVLFGLWAWMARTNGKGYSGARVAATILGVIGIMRGLGGFFVIGAFGGGLVGLVCSMILVVLAVTILVLLWQKESTDFYNARSVVQR
jgi:hypothetical protein